jgi:hypothetical protein
MWDSSCHGKASALLQLASTCHRHLQLHLHLLHQQRCYTNSRCSLACLVVLVWHILLYMHMRCLLALLVRKACPWLCTACLLNMAAQQQLDLFLQASACHQGLTKVQGIACRQAMPVALHMNQLQACHLAVVLVLWCCRHLASKVHMLLLLHSLAEEQWQQQLVRWVHPLVMLLRWRSLGRQWLPAAECQTMMMSSRKC